MRAVPAVRRQPLSAGGYNAEPAAGEADSVVDGQEERVRQHAAAGCQARARVTDLWVTTHSEVGTALAGALLDGGREVTVWKRTAGKADELVARGAREASSVEGAIGAGALTVVCLLDDASVREALAPALRELAGGTLVNLTSGSVRQARELAGWLGGYVRFLAGGIMAVPPTVGTEEALILPWLEQMLRPRI